MIPQNEQGIKQWLDELEKHPLTAAMREDLAADGISRKQRRCDQCRSAILYIGNRGTSFYEVIPGHGFGKNRAIKKRYAGHNDFHRISNQKNNSMMTKRILAGYCIKAAKRGI